MPLLSPFAAEDPRAGHACARELLAQRRERPQLPPGGRGEAQQLARQPRRPTTSHSAATSLGNLFESSLLLPPFKGRGQGIVQDLSAKITSFTSS